MHAKQLITPDLVLSKPIWSLTGEILEKYSLRGLILDVDNTLVRDDDKDVSPEVRQWIDTTRQDRQIWLISNNLSNRRIRRIAESLELPYRSRAGKPSRRVVRQAMEAMSLPPEQIAMIGDRLFTDTLVGNRLGLFTILVQPPGNEKSGSKKTSWLGKRSKALRNWEIWLARKSGVNI